MRTCVFVQELDSAGVPVTFRAVCQRLHPHLFAPSDSRSDSAATCRADEALVLAIITSLEQLLVSGQVVESVGGVRTRDELLRLSARRGKSKAVPPPVSPNVRVWRTVVRFYDDDNNLDVAHLPQHQGVREGGDRVRVPPEQRKIYEVNADFYSAAAAIRAGLSIRSQTERGTLPARTLCYDTF